MGAQPRRSRRGRDRELTGDVTDAEGRRGTAVTINAPTPVLMGKDGSGVMRNRLIFDEATGQALARDSVVVRLGGAPGDLAPGTMWYFEVILKAGWTDDRPAG